MFFKSCWSIFGILFGIITDYFSPDINIFENLDSDFDGIKDHDDQCQKTPINVSILPTGCPIDSDFDGIPDYKDLEPNSKSILFIDDSGRSVKRYTGYEIELKFDTIIPFKVDEF